LVTIAWSAIAFGVLLILGAWLAGQTAPARALRRATSPCFRERRGAAYALAAGIWVLLIAWAPIAAFRKPLGILVFAVLFALGTERREQRRSAGSGRAPEQVAMRRGHNGE
jgi:hypothetical protein